MPLLSSDHLVWDIGYHHANEDWYYYRMKLHWRGVPVINPAVRYPNDDGSPQDEIGMCHNDCDGLRHILDYALGSGRPVAWDSIEPDTRLAIYPGTGWPFCDNTAFDFHDSSRASDESAKQEQARLKEAFAPDGQWTFMIFIDTERLKESEWVTGDGLIVTLSTDRREVERFRSELQLEYEAFSARIGYREPENCFNPYKA